MQSKSAYKPQILDEGLYRFYGRITRVRKYADQSNVIVQGIKRENQGYYDMSNRYAGSNGTYVEFGEYRGVKLDFTYSLYDTDKLFLELQGKRFMLDKHVTVDIYKSLMQALNRQRLSPERLAEMESYEGQKNYLAIHPLEDTLQMLSPDTGVVILNCAMPFTVSEKHVTGAAQGNVLLVG